MHIVKVHYYTMTINHFDYPISGIIEELGKAEQHEYGKAKP